MYIAIVGLIFALCIVAALMAPGTALASGICVFAFETYCQAKIPFFAAHGSIINYASAVVVMVAFAAACLRGSVSLNRISSTEYAVAGFYILLLVSFLWAIDRPWWKSTIGYAAPYTIAYLALLPLVFGRIRDYDVGVKTVILTGGIISCLLLFTVQMHQWGRSVNVEGGVFDRYGNLERGGSPGAVAGLAGEVALLVVMAKWRRLKAIGIFLMIGMIAVACAVIFRTDTRGQLIAMVAVMCALPVFRWPKLDAKLIVGVPLILTILGIAVYWGYSFSMLQLRWQPDKMVEDFTSTRFILCSQVLDRWLHSTPWNWIFGLGAGASWSIIETYPHVIMVQVLCELGFVGLFIYLAFVYFVVRSFFSVLSLGGKDEGMRALACCLFALFLFVFLLGFKQGGITSIYSIFLPGVLLGRLESLMRSVTTAHHHRPARHPLPGRELVANAGMVQPGSAFQWQQDGICPD